MLEKYIEVRQMIAKYRTHFESLHTREKVNLILRETEDYTQEFVAFKYGLGERQIVTYYRRLSRLIGWPEGESLLDAIHKRRISFNKVHPALNRNITDEKVRKNVEKLLRYAATNEANGEQIGRGRNPFPDGRSRPRS